MSTTRRKRHALEEAGDEERQELFGPGGKGDGMDEELEKIMRALGITARPAFETVNVPVKSLIIPHATLPTVTEEANRIARSIPITGILDPIKGVLVAGASHRDPDARILVLDGRRRSVAAQIRELELIPCCLYDAQATTMQMQALLIAIGNLQRRDEWRREVEALNQLVRGEREISRGDQVRLSRAGLDAYGKELRDAVFSVEDDPLLHLTYDAGDEGDRFRLDGLEALVFPHEVVKVGKGLTEDQLILLGFAPETLRTRLAMAFLPDPLVELIVSGKMNEQIARWMVQFAPSGKAHFAELARSGQPITLDAVKRARGRQITPRPLPGAQWGEEKSAASPLLAANGRGAPAGVGSPAELLSGMRALIAQVAPHLDPDATPETEQVLFLFRQLDPLLEIVARQCAAAGAEHEEVQND